MKIIHVITGLEGGGAEMMLYKLLSEIEEDSTIDSEVISLLPDGPIGDRIRNLGVSVTTLDMPHGTLTWGGLRQLYVLLRREQPDIVQTWMYHADLVGGMVARLAGVEHVLWNIRSSTLNLDRDKRTTILTANICAWLSEWIPDRVLTCAREAGRVHAEIGYSRSKMTVIPNGFDTDEYRPDEEREHKIRNEIGHPDSLLVGLVARFHPQKDHRTFLEAAARVRKQVKNVHFVLCGDGVTWENDKLRSWVRVNELEDSVSLLGRREDVPAVMAALDLHVLSSATGEAFPNVVGEAMSCGVPCVVTRVGDSAEIVGDTGIAVRPEDAGRLAEACEQILRLSDQERQQLGAAARERVQAKYSLKAIGDRYIEVHREVLDGHGVEK